MTRRQTAVLVAGALILAISFGIRQSYGIFLQPMVRDLGWSFATFTIAIGLQNLVWGLTQPFAGAIADRWGSFWPILGGAMLLAISAFGTSMTVPESPWLFYVELGLLGGFAVSGCGLSVIFSAVARQFPPERHTFVLGCVGTGVSIGQLIFSPSSPVLIEAMGWQGTLGLYAAVALLLLPLAFAFHGIKPSPAQPNEIGMMQAAAEAGRHSGFIYLTAGFFVCGFHVTTIATFLPAYVASCGLPISVGAWAIAVIGVTNLVGSLTVGALGDRYRKKYLLSGLYFVRALLIAGWLALPVTTVSTMIFAALFGFTWLSTVPLTNGIVGQVFGTRYIGMLSGIVFLSHQLGSFFGAWYGGWVRDATGGYTGLWVAGIGIAVVAGLLNLPIADKPLARLSAAAR